MEQVRRCSRKLVIRLLLAWFCFQFFVFHHYVIKNSDFQRHLINGEPDERHFWSSSHHGKEVEDISHSQNNHEGDNNDAKGAEDGPEIHDYHEEDGWKNDLPEWMVTYLSWHLEMREKFPDEQLLVDPEAPKLLVRICLGLCGGLVDRLGQLPWDVYLAARTNRILLYFWARPTPLEDYLVPNVVNFTVPIPKWFPPDPLLPHSLWIHRKTMKVIKTTPDLFEGYPASHPTKDFVENGLEEAIIKANSNDEKIMRFAFLGHLFEDHLQTLIQKHFPSSKSNSIDVHDSAVYGNLFHIFFKPSAPLLSRLEQVKQNLGIDVKEFTAVHCRVRHPKAFARDNSFAAGVVNDLDANGFQWDNEQLRDYAIDHALRAFSCPTSSSKQQQPIFFISDTLELVKFVANKGNFTANMTKLEREARTTFDSMNIIVRNDSTEKNLHIDREKFGKPSDYFGTFIDLFIAMKAKCITYGIGNFAYFASKLSDTRCRYMYDQEKWGVIVNSKQTDSQLCRN